ncbi:MAG: phosphoadenosine phosphosulfate reductase family protein [Deltaproteobacteria bacterium]|nr:phosphoadenosine phosphosulfate reductase family protein [Deltaproteobacteria bacterium]MBW1848339.1 phosphoadenosine phosphosulfate reductase family protein [Deltaproteobacteria bacterium]MBW1985176.1 phosphoadenosine phosphosulfate reductase family protein [Deltaproteobacteria bacterium]MBW2178810.1 phosphoadenosine phosphosulfate reductase family protein [Deltaproteobacteria bacterium]MBW2364331.1 phosphoadenosine phosphosulfate reductase family protein [Deltaproteobacteria bacterium]
MKNYLSFGGGVNSVALYLYFLDNNVSFEAVFVDHGTDWPETYEYVKMFKDKYPLTVLKPSIQGYNNLYKYCWFKEWVPSPLRRWCTDKFKMRAIHKYCQKPCWQMLGIDFGEQKRAKMSSSKGFENRFPLIEAEIDREGCKDIIRSHKLPLPIKSGCFICPYQRVHQWKELRRNHPGLFCKAVELEKRNMEYRKRQGKTPMFLSMSKRSLQTIVDEKQRQIFKEDEYPPCNCGL